MDEPILPADGVITASPDRARAAARFFVVVGFGLLVFGMLALTGVLPVPPIGKCKWERIVAFLLITYPGMISFNPANLGKSAWSDHLFITAGDLRPRSRMSNHPRN